MGHYVYENWHDKRARVHKANCSHCNNGEGTHAAGNQYGKWSEHESREAAFQYMARLGYEDAKECDHCSP